MQIFSYFHRQIFISLFWISLILIVRILKIYTVRQWDNFFHYSLDDKKKTFKKLGYFKWSKNKMNKIKKKTHREKDKTRSIKETRRVMTN